MIYHKESIKKEVRTNMRDGKGEIEVMNLLDEAALGKNCRLFSKVTIKPGNSIGEHPHSNEREIYYFLGGSGQVTDDGAVFDVKPGDVMVTPDGHFHSVENTGEVDLEFVALIVRD